MNIGYMFIKFYFRKFVYDVDYKLEECFCRRVKDLEDLKILIWCGVVGLVIYIKVYWLWMLYFLWWMFDYSYNYYYMVELVIMDKIKIIYYVLKRIFSIFLFCGVVEIREEIVKIVSNNDMLDFVLGVFVIFKDKYLYMCW